MSAATHESALRVLLPRRNGCARNATRAAIRAHLAALWTLRLEATR